MELLVNYLEANPAPVQAISLQADRSNPWSGPLNSPAGHISVVACRRSGKTTAVCELALRPQDKDVIIICSNDSSRRLMVSALRDHSERTGLIFSAVTPRPHSYQTATHSIDIIIGMRAYQRGMFTDRRLIFDEPEAGGFGRAALNDNIAFLNSLMEVSDITMIGSYATREHTAVKEFHQIADESYVLDYTMFPQVMEMAEESRRHYSEMAFHCEFTCDLQALRNIVENTQPEAEIMM